MARQGRIACGALLLGVVAILAGCDGSDRSNHSHRGPAGEPLVEETFEGQYPIKAVATTGMVADVVRRVGGEHVRVEQLMGEGVDPHLYKASPGDIDKLTAADIVFYSGLHLEGKMSDMFVSLARRKPTFALTESIPEERLLEVESGLYDPHVWFDVSLWRETIGLVEKVLTAYDPRHAADYRASAEAYRTELAALDEEVREKIASIPQERRVLVTAHDAFSYFGRAYDIEVKAIQGISTESEASVRQINELVDFLVERKIKAVFVESSVSDRNVQALVEGARARGHEVTVGGELFSDAMGRPGTEEGTYPGMVRHNVETIIGALR